MTPGFKEKLSGLREKVDGRLKDILAEQKSADKLDLKLLQSMEYSLMTGGQRLRPSLVCLTLEALNSDIEAGLPLAAAIEMVHTYSLIHDDLPSMDNDDFRRGKPSNHKVFGEGMAVLAGDALLTEAFGVLSRGYASRPSLALNLINGLVSSAGAAGMVAGQAMDLALRFEKDFTSNDVEKVHIKKTGAILQFSVMGATQVAVCTPAQKQGLLEFSECLGLVFQISDDLMDELHVDEPNFVKSVGLTEARQRCIELVEKGRSALMGFDSKADGLREMITYFYERTKK